MLCTNIHKRVNVGLFTHVDRTGEKADSVTGKYLGRKGLEGLGRVNVHCKS